MLKKNKQPAVLVLSDGTQYEGYSIGAQGTVIGEVVFTTSMTGYQEMLTSPGSYGQMIAQTFPLVGNYGVNELAMESRKAWAFGYIVRQCCENPSNFRSEGDLNSWLKEQNVIGIEGIDTRSLTRKIREKGVMNGAITTEPIENKEAFLEKIKKFSAEDAVKKTSCEKAYKYEKYPDKSLDATLPKSKPNDKNNFKIAMFDFGAKENIAKSLLRRNCEVTVIPCDSGIEDIKNLNPDGIMLSNGPGDPLVNTEIIQNLKEVGKLKVPTFGIGLGHQLLALSSGAKTYKLKCGHSGGNQPVVDAKTKRTFITTQSHGYAVDTDSLDKEKCCISYYNANDKTCEGIAYNDKPAFSVQFHPEAFGGPLDTDYLFDSFMELIENNKH